MNNFWIFSKLMMILKMTTMKKINQIWEELASDNTISNGLLIRRFSGTIFPDIFVTIQNPGKELCLAISLSLNTTINISAYSSFQEIVLDIIPDSNDNKKKLLIIKLSNNSHRDVFATLCDDLINSISDEKNESNLVGKLLNRLEKWRILFSKISDSGLSQEEQIGLYGEILFLMMFLTYNKDYFNVISSWVGPEKEIRDFQFNSWGVEIKTTIGNNHQKVYISSERQLDTTHLENLYLFHVSLEKSHGSGETLPDIIKSIQDILIVDLASLNKFNFLLLQAGYFDKDFELYTQVGYHLRNNTFYNVKDDFPRLQEKDIKKGIGDVEYSLILSQCGQYIEPEFQVINKLTF